MSDVEQLIAAQRHLRDGKSRGVRPSIRSVGAHFALLGMAWVMLALAFPGPGMWVLAHFALVPAVILAVRAHSVRRLAWTSYVVSLMWWLFMLRWLTGVTEGGWIGLSILMAAYFTAALLIVRVIELRFRWPLVIAVPMAWVTMELIRGWFLQGGFGWFALGHSQAPWLPRQGSSRLIQVADIFGEYGVSFLVAMTNGVVLDLLLRPWVHRAQFGRHRSRFGVRESMILWTATYIAVLAYGYHRLNQWNDLANAADEEGSTTPALIVAAVQTNIPQDNKESRTLEGNRQMWTQLEALTQQAAVTTPEPELIVWPETMVPAAINPEAVRENEASAADWRQLTPEQMMQQYDQTKLKKAADSFGISLERLPQYFAQLDQENAECRGRISQLARLVNTPLLVGAPVAYSDERGRTIRHYNSAFLVYADGRFADEWYDKIYRVPFGEYLPWVELWPWLKAQFIKYLAPNQQDITLNAGTELTVFMVPRKARAADGSPLPDVAVCAPICFEDTISRLCRQMIYAPGGVKRADVLANLTNDGWFVGYSQASQQLQNAVLRCVENRVPMVRSVNTGVTGMISSVGRVDPLVTVDGKRVEVEGVAASELVLDDRRTLYGWWGNLPMIAMALCTGLATLGGVAGRRPRTRRTKAKAPA